MGYHQAIRPKVTNHSSSVIISIPLYAILPSLDTGQSYPERDANPARLVDSDESDFASALTLAIGEFATFQPQLVARSFSIFMRLKVRPQNLEVERFWISFNQFSFLQHVPRCCLCC